ncbi:suppressor APC domain-containing protein 1 isoform X2 [Lepidochelys kempii]|uniref:suppressor APC domain-containing protein 1 isoform X2 n=1 Tax=Lepidochelys kempii TaxID=8472 RepID=UPI003C704828
MTSLVASPPPAAPEDPALGLAPRLPRPFLRSLRTLFEILDEQRSGAVHLSEIESRWGRGGPGLSPPGGPQHELLPPGVLPALQQVAGPSGGFLSFPCLVAGLRIALLRDQEEEQGPRAEAAETGHNSAQERTSGGQTREGEPRGVTRSRSINSALSQAGQPRSLRVPKEPRRHTITHGIDYGALQRRQAQERERDALLQGLDLAERLRGWYRRHLLEAQRKQEQDYFPDSCPNQSCLLLAKIQEVNLGLRNLLASPGKPVWGPPCPGGEAAGIAAASRERAEGAEPAPHQGSQEVRQGGSTTHWPPEEPALPILGGGCGARPIWPPERDRCPLGGRRCRRRATASPSWSRRRRLCAGNSRRAGATGCPATRSPPSSDG